MKRTFLVSQTVEHVRLYCTATVTTCAGDKETVVLDPIDEERLGVEIRKEIKAEFFKRWVGSAIGIYVDIGPKYIF